MCDITSRVEHNEQPRLGQALKELHSRSVIHSEDWCTLLYTAPSGGTSHTEQTPHSNSKVEQEMNKT